MKDEDEMMSIWMPYTSTCIEPRDEEIDAKNQWHLILQLNTQCSLCRGIVKIRLWIPACLNFFLQLHTVCCIRCFLLPLFNNMVNGKEFIFCPSFKFGGDKIWIRSSPDVTYIPNLCHLVTWFRLCLHFMK